MSGPRPEAQPAVRIAAMEGSLAAIAADPATLPALRARLFGRLLDALPHRRAVFLNIPASAPRMTDETMQMLLGLARAEPWLWAQVTELVFGHRAYGSIPDEEHALFIDLLVEEMAMAAGAGWTGDAAAGWSEAAAQLKALVARARAEWAAGPLAFA